MIGDNAKYPNAFNVIGGEPINTDGSQVISPYFFFINGWKLRPQEANHQLTINGNLLSLDGTNPTIATLGGYEVFVRTILSVNSTSTTIATGSGLSAQQEANLNSIKDITDWMYKWATANEVIQPTRYQRLDSDTNDVLMDMDVNDDGNGNINITKRVGS